MTSMTTSQRERFLADTRLGILCTSAQDGSPRAVPVWFEWDGNTATMFTEVLSPKIARLEREYSTSGDHRCDRHSEDEDWCSSHSPAPFGSSRGGMRPMLCARRRADKRLAWASVRECHQRSSCLAPTEGVASEA